MITRTLTELWKCGKLNFQNCPSSFFQPAEYEKPQEKKKMEN